MGYLSTLIRTKEKQKSFNFGKFLSTEEHLFIATICGNKTILKHQHIFIKTKDHINILEY